MDTLMCSFSHECGDRANKCRRSPRVTNPAYFGDSVEWTSIMPFVWKRGKPHCYLFVESFKPRPTTEQGKENK